MSQQPPAPRTFSKGTMGLKFMQRLVASQPTRSNAGSSASASVMPNTSTGAKSCGSTEAGQNKMSVALKEEGREKAAPISTLTGRGKQQDDQLWQGATTTSRSMSTNGVGILTHVTHTLSFPALYDRYDRPRRKKRRLITTSGSLLNFPSIREQQQHTSTVSLMAGSSSASPQVMARWSFGGANEEIEQLTNPQTARGPQTKGDKVSEKEKHKSKTNPRPKSGSTLASLLSGSTSIRRNDQKGFGGNQKKRTFAKVEGREIAQGEGEDEQGMSFTGGAQLGLGEEEEEEQQVKGFRKPAGMEGFKKEGPSGRTRPSLEMERKRRKAENCGQEEGEEEPVWAKMGEERAWDVGKVEERSEDEDEDFEDSAGSSESSDDE
ncbi:BQ2448_6138 [Microbotryum intermedium]|uniref:BQ2448_6138 protein n=1 Tax=Microbotryum intermedium TaxID=269621 RepID=A0A238FR71_9BASI|nr:BQ2448_6138 [Microbotryum intermedium]